MVIHSRPAVPIYDSRIIIRSLLVLIEVSVEAEGGEA